MKLKRRQVKLKRRKKSVLNDDQLGIIKKKTNIFKLQNGDIIVELKRERGLWDESQCIIMSCRDDNYYNGIVLDGIKRKRKIDFNDLSTQQKEYLMEELL